MLFSVFLLFVLSCAGSYCLGFTGRFEKYTNPKQSCALWSIKRNSSLKLPLLFVHQDRKTLSIDICLSKILPVCLILGIQNTCVY